MWWDHEWNWAGWLAMSIGMASFWVFVALLVLAVIRAGRSTPEQEPRQILEQRLARGEIDIDEFHERLTALGQAER